MSRESVWQHLNFQGEDENVALDAELGKFFENSYLIDPFLGELVQTLAKLYLDSDRTCAWPVYSLYTISNIRGYKHVSKFLDPQPELLGETVRCLADHNQPWKVRFVLLLWLANLLLVPFRLEVLGEDLYEKIFALCCNDLLRVSKERDAAAYAMARLVTRSKNAEQINQFLVWCRGKPVVGTLQVLAHIARTTTVPFPREFTELAQLSSNDVEKKLEIKIRTRIALHLFPLQWELIEDTINFLHEELGDASSVLRYSSAKALANITAKCFSSPKHAVVGAALLDDSLNGFEQDWIKSKYGRLSQVSDVQWHGSLLYLGEILRKKSISVDIDRLLGVLQDALHFEQRRLSCSCGGNVRDAASYVCWALFRSGKHIQNQQLVDIYTWLISLACFDREVNVRRAAAAALQEGLGRHQGLPVKDSLDLIEKINFASVSNLAVCYLEIAPRVSPAPDLDMLLERGVANWDVNIRRIAARAYPLFKKDKTDALLQMFRVNEPEFKHGVLCALGNAYKGTAENLAEILSFEFNFSSELVCEGVLTFLKCVSNSHLAPEMMRRCMWPTDENVLKCIAELAPLMPTSELSYWLSRIDDGPCFVQAVAAKDPTQLVRVASLPSDPQSRKIFISSLVQSKKAEELIITALYDYQRDKRGDVGSWTRQAAVEKVTEWNLQSTKVSDALWKMTSESLDRLRQACAQRLRSMGFEIAAQDTPVEYFQSLFDHGPRQVVLPGMVICAGGRIGNAVMGEAALVVIARNLGTIAPDILELGWKGEIGSSVLQTIVKTLEIGSLDQWDKFQLLRIGYNATINTTSTSRILAGIEILSFLDDAKSRDRLVRLCGHMSVPIRQRASEALFELGYQSRELLETDWSLPESRTVLLAFK